MTSTALTRGAIDIGRLLGGVADPAHGATTVFVGSTRADGDGPHAVVALAYDAYEAMALDVMATLVDDIGTRFGARTAMSHRLGQVPAGEPSIAIAVSAPHRASTFAACRFAIEALKRDLPIWKQEIRADGSRTWRDGMALAIPSAP